MYKLLKNIRKDAQLIIREPQTKPKMRYQFISVRITIIKKQNRKYHVDGDVEKLESVNTAVGI